MKFTKEILRGIAKSVDDGLSAYQISKIFNYDLCATKRYVRRYRLHGLHGLLFKPTREEKEYLKPLVLSDFKNGDSLLTIAIRYNITNGTVANWVKRNEEGEYNTYVSNPKKRTQVMPKRKKYLNSKITTRLRDRNEELSNENKQLNKKLYRLQMENDCLKKLDSLVQEREQLESRRKSKR